MAAVSVKKGLLSVNESLCLVSCPVAARRLLSPSRSTDSDDVSFEDELTNSLVPCDPKRIACAE